jgi:hypothetical protein
VDREQMSLLWMGAIIGVFVDDLAHWIVSSVAVVRLPSIIIPFATLVVWAFFFYVTCYPAYYLTRWAFAPSVRYLWYSHWRRIVLQRLGRWRR